MGKSYTPSEAKRTRATRRGTNNRRMVDGVIVDKAKSRNTYRILIGLKERGIEINNSIGTNDAAALLLGEYDCAIIEGQKNISLVGDQTELIENENILDEAQLNELNPEDVKATDKFVDTDDPFYNLDDDIPENVTAENTKVKNQTTSNYIMLASQMVNQNMRVR